MLESDLQTRIDRAKELIKTVRHVPIATVNTDGSPHNSPVFAAFDDDLRMIWASSPNAQHSQNIARTGQAFAVLFDSMDAGGGLFIKGTARQLADDELDAALTIFNQRREAQLAEHVLSTYFTGSGPQRLYVLASEQLWVNIADRDGANHILEDKRYAVARDQFVL